MTSLLKFPITKKWPAKFPDKLQLYSIPTPNGVKISIMLEEIDLPYEAHLLSMSKKDQFTKEFLSLNPNNKIPAIIDPNGPNNTPLPLWESGAILIYLAEKTSQLLSNNPALRYETLQWLLFQVGGIGPMFGQLNYFHRYAGKEITDSRPRQRYQDETSRLLQVLDTRLKDKKWVMDTYSIADIAIAPWLKQLSDDPQSKDLVAWDNLKNIPKYLENFLERPAVQAGYKQPSKA